MLKKWFWEKALPMWAKETLMEDNRQLRRQVRQQRVEKEILLAHIRGMEKACRWGRYPGKWGRYPGRCGKCPFMGGKYCKNCPFAEGKCCRNCPFKGGKCPDACPFKDGKCCRDCPFKGGKCSAMCAGCPFGQQKV